MNFNVQNAEQFRHTLLQQLNFIKKMNVTVHSITIQTRKTKDIFSFMNVLDTIISLSRIIRFPTPFPFTLITPNA